MLAVGANLEDRNPPYVSVSYLTQVWALIHWPVFFILSRMPHLYDMRGFYQAGAVLVGYWTTIGVVAAVFVWLVRTWRMRKRQTYVA